MMKLRCLCFLVLAVSSLSRGRTQSSEDKTPTPESGTSPAPKLPSRDSPGAGTTQGNLTDEASPAESSPGQTTNWVTATDEASPDETSPTQTANGTDDGTQGVNASSEAATTTTTAVPGGGRDGDGASVTNGVSIATTSTSLNQGTNEAGSNSSWAYVILVLIILMIIALCVILYLLRRASKTYSFDLQRPIFRSHLNEPIGTFEPVYLDDIDPPCQNDQATVDCLPLPPVANGTTPHAEENAPIGEIAPPEQPDANDRETSLTSSSNPSVAEDPADKASITQNSANVLIDSVGEDQQNENNNNPPDRSSGPFVEINLNDPAWGDQLFTAPEVTVAPFPPLSFSSSSSSSLS